MNECETTTHALLDFETVAKNHLSSVGGKAYALAQLSTAGFPVPKGCILQDPDLSADEWSELLHWWRALGNPPLAVRSSAVGEDSIETSFAGQLQSFLNVTDQDALASAIRNCFASINSASVKSYQTRMGREAKSMNVLVQQMISAAFSGVFFSIDPRGLDLGWYAEYVVGLGESLVSGQVTPFAIGEFSAEEAMRKAHPQFTREFVNKLAHYGRQTEKHFGVPIDMEWAIDEKGKFWVLQARPVTTKGTSMLTTLKTEWLRLQTSCGRPCNWDAHPFAEWPSSPAILTLEIWQNAFAAQGAFATTMRELGYEGLKLQTGETGKSLMDVVLGRPYLNLERLQESYFHNIPFEIQFAPHAQLIFKWSKVTAMGILRTPYSLYRMARVAWNFQTQRQTWLESATAELSRVENEFVPLTADQLSSQDLDSLSELLEAKVNAFANAELHFPFLITAIADMVTANLTKFLEADLGREAADSMLQKWMSEGLDTVSLQMNHEFERALSNPKSREEFLERFGFRGPGELDLAQPRWQEVAAFTFDGAQKNVQQNFQKNTQKNNQKNNQKSELNDSSTDEESFSQIQKRDLKKIGKFRRLAAKQEWALLVKLMQLREAWKMQTMRQYAEIRKIAVCISSRVERLLDLPIAKASSSQAQQSMTGAVANDWLFWLNLEEILTCAEHARRGELRICKDLVSVSQQRKAESEIFHKIHLPSLLNIEKLEALILEKTLGRDGESRGAADSVASAAEGTGAHEYLQGQTLSLGTTQGQAVVVTDFSRALQESWPEDAILVAIATDPGCTPLFQRVRAVVVERGGALSHSAIVAREMGMPAVGEIMNCTEKIKTGDRILVDGDQGRVYFV